AGEGLLARGHLVEHDAEGEQIAAGIYRLAAGLLWRHVDSRAGNDADGGQRIVRARIVFGAQVVDELGESEVEDFYLSGRGEKNVGGLDVAVDDVLGMRGHQGIGYLDGNVERLIHRHRTSGNMLLQALTF